MAAVVDRYGSESIRTVIQRVRVDDYPFRTATADLDIDNIDGVRIRTTAAEFLKSYTHRATIEFDGPDS